MIDLHKTFDLSFFKTSFIEVFHILQADLPFYSDQGIFLVSQRIKEFDRLVLFSDISFNISDLYIIFIKGPGAILIRKNIDVPAEKMTFLTIETGPVSRDQMIFMLYQYNNLILA